MQAYTPGSAPRRGANTVVPNFKAFRKRAPENGGHAPRAFDPQADYCQTVAGTEAFLRCAVRVGCRL